MPSRSQLISDLLGTVGRFRRQIRRTSSHGPDVVAGLTESQAELVRLVGRRPGISVSQAAAELGLAANTASTLVSRLCAGGSLIREADPADRRVGRLRLTPDIQSAADESRNARRSAISHALDDLDDTEIDQLTAGLDVLAKLTRMLQERQT
ncbi:MarR family winged helix-turn-helix transcriptional regulator [Mycolicibacterium komossense]|uniref:Winged helix-turn-helix transcriptional regulator n=1 Tax=Mycolicibacterium komossense TaxID=1779 RepID=A0ABT3C8N3_9MYCO|nr:MarR family winged helix-turn-helix transcriptional regulator [Mycolicibacterium komossense]MCV7225838.1 winged helix-turn-helix transcriptional regulator [Mycolicibacterium komossense]